jgi:hypothetical protein
MDFWLLHVSKTPAKQWYRFDLISKIDAILQIGRLTLWLHTPDLFFLSTHLHHEISLF